MFNVIIIDVYGREVRRTPFHDVVTAEIYAKAYIQGVVDNSRTVKAILDEREPGDDFVIRRYA